MARDRSMSYSTSSSSSPLLISPLRPTPCLTPPSFLNNPLTLSLSESTIVGSADTSSTAVATPPPSLHLDPVARRKSKHTRFVSLSELNSLKEPSKKAAADAATSAASTASATDGVAAVAPIAHTGGIRSSLSSFFERKRPRAGSASSGATGESDKSGSNEKENLDQKEDQNEESEPKKSRKQNRKEIKNQKKEAKLTLLENEALSSKSFSSADAASTSASTSSEQKKKSSRSRLSESVMMRFQKKDASTDVEQENVTHEPAAEEVAPDPIEEIIPIRKSVTIDEPDLKCESDYEEVEEPRRYEPNPHAKPGKSILKPPKPLQPETPLPDYFPPVAQIPCKAVEPKGAEAGQPFKEEREPTKAEKKKKHRRARKEKRKARKKRLAAAGYTKPRRPLITRSGKAVRNAYWRISWKIRIARFRVRKELGESASFLDRLKSMVGLGPRSKGSSCSCKGMKRIPGTQVQPLGAKAKALLFRRRRIPRTSTSAAIAVDSASTSSWSTESGSIDEEAVFENDLRNMPYWDAERAGWADAYRRVRPISGAFSWNKPHKPTSAQRKAMKKKADEEELRGKKEEEADMIYGERVPGMYDEDHGEGSSSSEDSSICDSESIDFQWRPQMMTEEQKRKLAEMLAQAEKQDRRSR